MYYDFSNCKLSYRSYGGSEKKLGIEFDGDLYMLKSYLKLKGEKHENHN